jgi:hypothetical protein
MILDFRSRNARAEQRDRDDTASAEIIIFPGVRREHHGDERPKPARRKRGPKRDRLELPD